MKFGTIHTRDIVAVLCLAGGFWLTAKGINSFVTTMMALIVGYYFSKRVFEESNSKPAQPAAK